MGLYESKPNTTKTNKFHDGNFVYATSSSMQGWSNMQEETLVMVKVQNVDVIAVIDGHGGKMIAEYIEKHLKDFLENDNDFKAERYKEAIDNVFQKFDRELRTEAGQKEINQLRQANTQSQAGDEKFCGAVMNICIVTEKNVFFGQLGNALTLIIDDFDKPEVSLPAHDVKNINEKTRVEAQGGVFDENGRVSGIINVTRTIGDFDLKMYDEKSTVPPQFIQTPKPNPPEKIIDNLDLGAQEQQSQQKEKEFEHVINGGDLKDLPNVDQEKSLILSKPDVREMLKSDFKGQQFILMGSDAFFEIESHDQKQDQKQEQKQEQRWKEIMKIIKEYKAKIEEKKVKGKPIQELTTEALFRPLVDSLLDKQMATEQNLKDGLGAGNMTAILIKLK